MSTRNTKSKQAILEVLQAAKRAISHDVVQEALGDSVDRATIYRVLNRFCDEGITHRIVGDDGKQYFALCSRKCTTHQHKHDHFHFRCLSCDTVECLSTQISVSLPKGYRAENFNGFISGYCNACC
ncbi:MAG: transcriptional repressor [Flavipsychrobacter sp.]